MAASPANLRMQRTSAAPAARLDAADSLNRQTDGPTVQQFDISGPAKASYQNAGRSLGMLRRLRWTSAVLLFGTLLTCTHAGHAPKPTHTGPAPSPLNPGPTRAEVWASLLQRPLRLQTIPAGKACPASRSEEISRSFGKVLDPTSGPGIAYPVLGGGTSVLPWVYSRANWGEIWGGQKVLWVVRKHYTGPVLVRGRRIDGPEDMRFSDSSNPWRELQLPEGEAVQQLVENGPAELWREYPSYTRVRAAGCYAYQVDGLGFTSVFVFKAIHDSAGDHD